MSNRRIANVPRDRQRDLSHQFSWLMDVEFGRPRADVRILSVSIFDHWLSREDACANLENIPASEQARRKALLTNFCERMISATEVLSFVQRGSYARRLRFRKFLSKEVTSAYCRPNGGKVFGQRHFHVVLPEMGCAFYESWDDTWHFFFVQPGIAEAALPWAKQSGVYLLDH